jgi:type IV pilus assembly protein PilM
MAAHFGLDISSSSIKVAEAKAGKDGFELEAFGEVRTPVSLQSKNPQDEAILVRAIKQLLIDSQIRSRNAYIALPELSIYTRVIQLPVLTEQELDNALKFEAEQYIPVPLEEVYLEHQILFTPTKNVPNAKMDVLLVAAKKWMVDRLVKISEMVEVAPLVVESALLGAIRSLKTQIGKNALLVDSGDSSTNVAIIQDEVLKQTSNIPTGGKALTRAIAQNLSLPEHQARQYKHSYGLEKELLEGKIAASLNEPISAIVNHIVKNIRFANTLSSENKVNQIIISGGTALLPGFTHHLLSQLDMEVNLANPLTNCTNTNLPQQLVSAAPRFATVIGLAIRE